MDALKGIDLEIQKGEYVSIVGLNGSGKSTLALHLNGILKPTSGKVWIDSHDTTDPSAERHIRRSVGLVLQFPSDQIVATIVEEDVAFGPENLGISEEDLPAIVDKSLRQVGMLRQRKRAPHQLSAGQQQLVALAGILAMDPLCLVLDEPTSMLDPSSVRKLLEILDRLHRRGVTIVYITHKMEEAARAERVLVLSEGRLVLEGTPKGVFTSNKLSSYGIRPPAAMQLSSRLKRRIPAFPDGLLTIDELADALTALKDSMTEEGRNPG
jgi:energy-coupling factor transport system ATP-binding protein